MISKISSIIKIKCSILLSLCILSFTACERCGKDTTAYMSGVTFKLLSKRTSQNLLDISGVYHPDTVKIYDGEGKVVFGGPVGKNGRISFSISEEGRDEAGFQGPVTKDFYLYLNHEDTDTITTIFELLKDDCGNAQYSYVKLYFNGTLSDNPPGLFYK